MGKKLAHFDDPNALMTTPETRSSSPVRIKRGKNLPAYWPEESMGQTELAEQGAAHDKAVNCQESNSEECGSGIYPCGEGPGFAGGIMSAACDGLRVACSIVKSLCS